MVKYKVAKRFSNCLLLLFLLFNVPVLLAQKIVDSGEQSAGFRFATDDAVSNPVIHYQLNIHMLSGINDRPSLKVFGSGRVFVHHPVYMKKAGDYEMRLDMAELVALLGSLSRDGLMDFDEKKVRLNKEKYRASLAAKGQLYEISDAVITSIEIRLDEYQKNKSAQKITNFHKFVQLKNIEQDAKRFNFDSDITKANNSALNLKALMNDTRLLKNNRK